jgi:uncharacterized membrane protein YebE (DUF533 family)
MPDDRPHSAPLSHPSPFRSQETAKTSFLNRLLHRRDPEDVKTDLESLFASKQPSSVSPKEVSDLMRVARLPAPASRETLVWLWEKALRFFLKDNVVSAAEADYLNQLRVTLGLTQSELDAVEAKLIHPLYAKAVHEAMADGSVSAQERERLEALMSGLRLSPDAHAKIYGEAARRVFTDELARATADNRLSPHEIAVLSELSTKLGIQVQLDGATRAHLERLALLWRIENESPPVIQSQLHLQKNELCHASAPAVWMEQRTRTVRIDYAGPVASFRICKGLRYRVGSFSPNRVTKEEFVTIDTGHLYITSKRIVFDGTKRNAAFRYASLLGFQPFTDAVLLEKSSGRNPLFMLNGDVEIFLTILSAAMARG